MSATAPTREPTAARELTTSHLGAYAVVRDGAGAPRLDPLREEELKAKFFDCVAGAEHIDANFLYEKLTTLDDVGDVRDLASISKSDRGRTRAML